MIQFQDPISRSNFIIQFYDPIHTLHTQITQTQDTLAVSNNYGTDIIFGPVAQNVVDMTSIMDRDEHSLKENKIKKYVSYFLKLFPRKLFFFEFGNPKVTVLKVKGHST